MLIEKAKPWNPHIGCSQVSDGCAHCRAAQRAMELRRYTQIYKDGGQMYLDDDAMEAAAREAWDRRRAEDADFRRENTRYVPRLRKGGARVSPAEGAASLPTTRKQPSVYWVDEMSDLFHPALTDADIDAVFDVIMQCRRHLFLATSKRAARMRDYARKRLAAGGAMPGNLWLGVSVENRAWWDKRVGDLAQTPAARRYVVAEPLMDDLGDNLDLRLIDWVLCGGAQKVAADGYPMQDEWVEGLWRQCKAAKVPFYFLQLGNARARGAPFLRNVSQAYEANGGDAAFLDGYARQVPDYRARRPYFYAREAPQWSP